MTTWGKKIDHRAGKPGWRDDPERPGVQRYWTGDEWDDSIAARSKPEPAWKGARMIALGILIAVAVVWFIYRASQPTDLECLEQATDVVTGDRVAVESACLDR